MPRVQKKTVKNSKRQPGRVSSGISIFTTEANITKQYDDQGHEYLRAYFPNPDKAGVHGWLEPGAEVRIWPSGFGWIEGDVSSQDSGDYWHVNVVLLDAGRHGIWNSGELHYPTMLNRYVLKKKPFRHHLEFSGITTQMYQSAVKIILYNGAHG
jgi:hypothetical protein